ncbi:hypothetical protein Ndes2526B_g02563 [Nannochloris sp. 'desiccata']|nr:hypothetical protein KSW81_007138 [Chlorella desiccata (nom. nud.)]KAH7621747.1 hypothetical protein NADE_004350 [Chlorella desiccata (nom. nud.)]
MSGSKVIAGLCGGFAASFAVWSFQRMNGTAKLPHTVVNTEWAAATRAMNAAKERVSADPIRLNPVGGNW